MQDPYENDLVSDHLDPNPIIPQSKTIKGCVPMHLAQVPDLTQSSGRFDFRYHLLDLLEQGPVPDSLKSLAKLASKETFTVAPAGWQELPPR
jgi:hypothetical protein